MTDKELIQDLREDAEWAAANEWETPITLGDNLAAAADRLEALLAENDHLREATKMMPKWISVSERLPELNVMVVGIVKDNPFSQYVHQVVHRNEHGWVFTYSMRYVTDVTHWMPLPEPPSTEGVE